MPDNIPTSEILNRAADLIEERGWQQGNDGMLIEDGVPLCLEGGIAAAMGLEAWISLYGDARLIPAYAEVEACPAYAAVAAYLDDPDGREVWAWNDVPSRTATEVIEVLRAAAAIEAAREVQPHPIYGHVTYTRLDPPPPPPVAAAVDAARGGSA